MTDVKLKPLPIGVEFFDDMIENNYYYVDKTLLIKNIIKYGIAFYRKDCEIKLYEQS
ncbi:MAG: AAA family ATPase [Turicibacter sp.]|nr:AAA family ATPase [Turicibacter sp.]